MTIYRMQFYPEKEFQHFTFSLRWYGHFMWRTFPFHCSLADCFIGTLVHFINIAVYFQV
jgi:hypothetical protein